MSRKDDTMKLIETLSKVVEQTSSTSPVEDSAMAMVGINGQMVIHFAELVDEICAIRKDLDELGRDVKRIERNTGKK